jgi:hypothetical protein
MLVRDTAFMEEKHPGGRKLMLTAELTQLICEVIRDGAYDNVAAGTADTPIERIFGGWNWAVLMMLPSGTLPALARFPPPSIK